jgi:hypothetical protein
VLTPIAKWTASERTTMRPTEHSVLSAVLPAFLRRRISSLYSLPKSIISIWLHSPVLMPGLHGGIVCSSGLQLEYYEVTHEPAGDGQLPTMVGGDQESPSSQSGSWGLPMAEGNISRALSEYEVESGLRWNRVVPGTIHVNQDCCS